MTTLYIVTPAKAGAHPFECAGGSRPVSCCGWIPAFAGMTMRELASL